MSSEQASKRLRAAVLEMIGNIEIAEQPWCSRVCLDELDEIPLDAQDERDLESLESCLRSLEAEGVIESSFDAHGYEQFALTEALRHPDYLRTEEAYSTLKETVLAEARRQGFSARWHPDRSWQLRRSGEVIHEGPLRELAPILGIQVL